MVHHALNCEAVICTSVSRTAVSNSQQFFFLFFFLFFLSPIRRTTFDSSSLKLQRDRERRFAIISIVTNVRCWKPGLTPRADNYRNSVNTESSLKRQPNNDPRRALRSLVSRILWFLKKRFLLFVSFKQCEQNFFL